MAFVITDRIKMTSTTTGTGTLTLGSAVTGFGAFSLIGDGNTTGYAIIGVDASGVPTGEWETGIGTYTSAGTTLSRGVIKSSNSNAAVSFSAGTKHVICTDVAGYCTPLVMATTANRAIQVADQGGLGSTAGNARGVGAVDLQGKRNSATKVASGAYSVRAGGRNGTASGNYSFCGGGYGGIASGGESVCVGGAFGVASATYAVVVGGESNHAYTAHSFVGGGKSNEAKTNSYATVVGGKANIATGAYSFIGSGRSHAASGTSSGIVGGKGHIASGSYSFVGGGYTNTASATETVVCGGFSNQATTSFGVICGGSNNTVNGDTFGVILGGKYNTASNVYATASGYRASASKFGQIARASGRFAANGDAQVSQFTLRKQTTNGTQAEIFLDGAAYRMSLANDTTWTFNGLMVARRTDTDGTNSSWEFKGCVKRDTNAASTALVGTCVPVVIMQDAGAVTWAVDVTADTTNGALRLRVTGEAAKTINWVVVVNSVETTG